jgi:hypothetical protein
MINKIVLEYALWSLENEVNGFFQKEEYDAVGQNRDIKRAYRDIRNLMQSVHTRDGCSGNYRRRRFQRLYVLGRSVLEQGETNQFR